MCTTVNAILQMSRLSHNKVKSIAPSSTATQHYIKSPLIESLICNVESFRDNLIFKSYSRSVI